MTTIWMLLQTMPAVFAGSIQRYVDESGRVVFTNLGTDRSATAPALNPLLQAAAQAASSPASPEELYASLIEDAAGRYKISPDLVKAMIRVESNFNPDAVSNKGCKGLMQLLPDTAKRFGVKDVFDPTQNVEGGVKYLRFLLDYFKNDLSLALAGYNAGENAVTRYKGIPPYRETRDYVKKVTALYQPPADGLAGEDVAVAAPPVNRKIYRVVQADGRILFTNTPTESVD
ncbi:MAG: lytic transglycosylase domain-containing protein [Acidobacteriota bacterium]